MSPFTTDAWILQGQNGIDSLTKVPNKHLPALGDYDVLVQLHAASLNHRDLAIAEVYIYIPIPCPRLNLIRNRASTPSPSLTT